MTIAGGGCPPPAGELERGVDVARMAVSRWPRLPRVRDEGVDATLQLVVAELPPPAAAPASAGCERPGRLPGRPAAVGFDRAVAPPVDVRWCCGSRSTRAWASSVRASTISARASPRTARRIRPSPSAGTVRRLVARSGLEQLSGSAVVLDGLAVGVGPRRPDRRPPSCGRSLAVWSPAPEGVVGELGGRRPPRPSRWASARRCQRRRAAGARSAWIKLGDHVVAAPRHTPPCFDQQRLADQSLGGDACRRRGQLGERGQIGQGSTAIEDGGAP